MQDDKPREISKTDAEWRAQLDPMQYQVARQAGTERAFTGKYWDHWEPGRYHCIGCDTPLFAADTKFDAGCGWPSYWEPINATVSVGAIHVTTADGSAVAVANATAGSVADQIQQALSGIGGRPYQLS